MTNKPRTIPDVLEDMRDRRDAIKSGTVRWGRWRYVPDARVVALYDDDGIWLYEVDLERMRDSATILDPIMQVAKKKLIPAEDLGWLVKCLNELLHPQEVACSWGHSTTFDVAKIMGWEGKRL